MVKCQQEAVQCLLEASQEFQFLMEKCHPALAARFQEDPPLHYLFAVAYLNPWRPFGCTQRTFKPSIKDFKT